MYHLLFALNKRGGCAVYHRISLRLIRYLNTSSGDIIRSFFWNQQQNALITVSVRSTDSPWALYCRSTPLSAITANPPLSIPHFTFACTPILTSESLQYPGFVEFDDLNQVILSYNHHLHEYKVWRMSDYHCIQQVTDTNVREVKTCPGLLMLIRERNGSIQRLDIRDVYSGVHLRTVEQTMAQDPSLTEYIELFNDHIILKEQGGPLVIVDCLDEERRTVVEGFVSPDSFLFLYQQDRFLTFKGQEVVRWNGAEGLEEEERFEGVHLVHGGHTSLLYISRQQDVLVSYGADVEREGGFAVNLSHIETGRLIGKVGGWRTRIPQENTCHDTLREEENGQERVEGMKGRSPAGSVGTRRRKRKGQAGKAGVVHGPEEGRERRRSQRVKRRHREVRTRDEEDAEEEKQAAEVVEVTERQSSPSVRLMCGEVRSDEDTEEEGDDGEEWDEEAGRALQGVTALYYHEIMDELVTGTQDGKLHIWGRG